MIDLPCWSEQLRRRCTSEAYISELWLFGSFAKGCATPDSDIDLACVMAGAERLANWIFESDRMKAEIEALIPHTYPL